MKRAKRFDIGRYTSRDSVGAASRGYVAIYISCGTDLAKVRRREVNISGKVTLTRKKTVINCRPEEGR